MPLIKPQKNIFLSTEVPTDSDGIDGDVWIKYTMDYVFRELFTGATDSLWSSAKWRDTYQNAYASGAFTVYNNQGRSRLATTDALQAALQSKTTQEKIFDFSVSARTIEFDVNDYTDDTVGAAGSLYVALCPAVPTGAIFSEAAWLRFGVLHSTAIGGTNIGIILQRREAIFYTEERTDSGTLTKYRIIITDANNVKLERWNGSSWDNLLTLTTADLGFTSAYVVIEHITRSTATIPLLFDNIRIIA